MSKNALIEKLTALIDPITTELNYELYHIEYVREGNEYYLRIYIDRENGGISLEDCEKVSRAVSDILDIEDPIQDSYYLEVSSPGIDRVLHTDKHLERYKSSQVQMKLLGPVNGKKKFEGELLDFNSEVINIKCEEEVIEIPRNKIAKVNLKVEF